MQIISEVTRKVSGNEGREDAVLGQIIRVWVNRMSFTFQPERRKLLSLALCSLLGANSPPSVLQHFPLIISNIVETLNDMTKYDNIGYDIEHAIEYVRILYRSYIIIKNNTVISIIFLIPVLYRLVDNQVHRNTRMKIMEINTNNGKKDLLSVILYLVYL